MDVFSWATAQQEEMPQPPPPPNLGGGGEKSVLSPEPQLKEDITFLILPEEHFGQKLSCSGG